VELTILWLDVQYFVICFYVELNISYTKRATGSTYTETVMKGWVINVVKGKSLCFLFFDCMQIIQGILNIIKFSISISCYTKIQHCII